MHTISISQSSSNTAAGDELSVQGIRRKQKAGRKRIRKQNDGDNKTDAQRLQEELFGADDGERFAIPVLHPSPQTSVSAPVAFMIEHPAPCNLSDSPINLETISRNQTWCTWISAHYTWGMQVRVRSLPCP